MTHGSRRAFRQSPTRTADHVRILDADILIPPTTIADPGVLPSEIEDSDEYLQVTQALLREYAGIIFTGPPGTSKSWYARNIAAKLADGDPTRVEFVQFHPSYQYEDFVEGYVPRPDGAGFSLEPKHLLKLCEVAEDVSPALCVLVIDELSRGDPGRIFGEALTYIERSRRGQEFSLSSGRRCSIPENLAILATMNPLDRGVDEVDAAFERRFAKISMEPSDVLLRKLLSEAGMPDAVQQRVNAFFSTV